MRYYVSTNLDILTAMLGITIKTAMWGYFGQNSHMIYHQNCYVGYFGPKQPYEVLPSKLLCRGILTKNSHVRYLQQKSFVA